MQLPVMHLPFMPSRQVPFMQLSVTVPSCDPSASELNSSWLSRTVPCMHLAHLHAAACFTQGVQPGADLHLAYALNARTQSRLLLGMKM